VHINNNSTNYIVYDIAAPTSSVPGTDPPFTYLHKFDTKNFMNHVRCRVVRQTASTGHVIPEVFSGGTDVVQYTRNAYPVSVPTSGANDFSGFDFSLPTTIYYQFNQATATSAIELDLTLINLHKV